jgi:hypothetical protein
VFWSKIIWNVQSICSDRSSSINPYEGSCVETTFRCYSEPRESCDPARCPHGLHHAEVMDATQYGMIGPTLIGTPGVNIHANAASNVKDIDSIWTVWIGRVIVVI